MDKKTAIIIVIGLIIFISIRIYIAMNVPSAGNKQTSFSFPLGLPAVFTGTLPCASCSSIDTHLLIDSTGFREVSRYIGEEDGPFTTRGTWKILGTDSLFLNSDEEVYKTYMIGNDSLSLLDQAGNRIEGTLEENYVLAYSEMETQIRRFHEELRQRGFKFIASGNEPFWSIRVTNKDVVIYQTPEIRKSGSLEQYTFDDTSTTLDAALGSGETLQLFITDGYCQDTMSGFLFTHTVTLQFNGDKQAGCGRFLSNN